MNAKRAGQIVLLKLSLLLLVSPVFAEPAPAEELEQAAPASKAGTTTVYKVVNPDGSVSFSDQPQDHAQTLQVAPVTTIPAQKVIQNQKLTPDNKPSAETTYYQSLSISSPADDSAFHSGSGNIQVTVDLNPSLRPGHSLELILDSTPIATQASTQFQLTNVDRGTHTLTIKILDPQQQVLKSSSSKFTLHRP